MNRRFASLTLSLCGAAMLCACAGTPTVTASPAALAGIRAVNVVASVPMPETMYYHGRGQSVAAALAGPIGAAVAASAAEEPKAQIAAAMQANDISLPQIVKAQFQREANAGGAMKFAEGLQPADAELTLAVNVYGFSQSQGLSALLYPMLRLSATLKRPDGSIVWQKADYLMPQSSLNTEGHALERYLAEPELLRKALTSAAQSVSRMLVADLQGPR